MREFVRRYMYLIPPIMLLGDLLSVFIPFNYNIMGNILGNSILTNIVILWVFELQRKKYCWFTKNAVYALFVFNILNIVGDFIDFEHYRFIYTVGIVGTTILLSLILTIKKL